MESPRQRRDEWRQRVASHGPGNTRAFVYLMGVAAADEPGAIDDALTLAHGERVVGGVNGRSGTAFGAAKRAAIAAFERAYFASLAKRCKGNVSEMARQSGMERHHVRAYLRKYGIDKSAS